MLNLWPQFSTERNPAGDLLPLVAVVLFMDEQWYFPCGKVVLFVGEQWYFSLRKSDIVPDVTVFGAGFLYESAFQGAGGRLGEVYAVVGDDKACRNIRGDVFHPSLLLGTPEKVQSVL